MVTLQVKRLDRAINAIWDSVLNGDAAAIDRLQRLIDQQGRLLGYNGEEVRIDAERLSVVIDR